MTREEATINALRGHIEALEQEPCEPVGNSDKLDCISRQAVINAIYANSVWENEYNLTSSRIKKAVEELPSINSQEPKTDVFDKIIADIQTLRGCSCNNSDGIIDDVEDIIDKYRQEG